MELSQDRESESQSDMDEAADSVVLGEAVEPGARPWLLQDWIALTVAVVLTGLFISTAWTTLRDLPVVLRQIKGAKTEIAKIQGAVEDPVALKRRLEKTIRKADEDIFKIQEAISKLEQKLIEEAARKANLEREKEEEGQELAGARGIWEKALDSAKSKLKKEDLDLSFDELWEKGPGEEPDPNGPNFLRKEWQAWWARAQAHKLIKGELQKPLAALQTVEKSFQEVETALARVECAFEMARESISSHTDKLNRITKERNKAEELLKASLVEPDESMVRKIQMLRKQLRESESIKTGLWCQNMPTVFVLFVVSISAVIRLALLRGHFKSRTLIPS